MHSSSNSTDFSSEETDTSSPPRDGAIYSPPVQENLPEHDARAPLALFEGHPDEEEGAPKNGEAAKNGALDLADDASIREFYAQLVSLLTNENANPAPKPPTRSSLRFALRRRALPTLVVAALAFVALGLMLRPKQVIYTAQTQLLLPPRPSGGMSDPLAPPETSYDTAAQIAIIGSDELTLDAMKHVPSQTRLKGWGTTAAFSPGVGVAAAAPDGTGSLVEISVPSLDADASEKLATEVVNAYTRFTLNRSTQNQNDNLSRTRARVAQVGAQLEQARQAQAELKIKSGVSDAKIAQNSAASNIEQLKNAISAARGEAISALSTDSTLAQLQDRLRVAKTAYQTVTRDFFENSDRARAAQADVDTAKAAISTRENELRSTSSAKIAQLEASLSQARANAQRLPGIEQQQDRLDQRIAVLESAYRTATERLNQLDLATNAVPPTAKQLTSPYSSSSRTIQLARALFVALLGALGVGLLAALLLDRLDKTVRATPDPEALWNAPVLGALPASHESDAFFRSTPSNQKGNPKAKTQSIEACYLAQSNILALAQNAGVRSILFSSALKEEGKATTAANIAVAMAYGGRETLLIDADFWNPSQHLNFGVPLAPGYAQVLRDDLPLSEAIRPTTVNNLYVLTPGQNASAGMGVLMSRLQGAPHTKNMTLLKKYFDVIVVDGPHAASLADAQLLAHLADAVVLVSAESTSRAEVQRARSMLRLSGAFLLGVVLNRVRSSEVSDWNLQFTPEGK
ncbi:putative tyrosine-protein kinase YveL [Abditibacteriota bacterium]|nr:putative tyrosine-protein kinase YveL [Abditibacteriota bacterium]